MFKYNISIYLTILIFIVILSHKSNCYLKTFFTYKSRKLCFNCFRTSLDSIHIEDKGYLLYTIKHYPSGTYLFIHNITITSKDKEKGGLMLELISQALCNCYELNSNSIPSNQFERNKSIYNSYPLPNYKKYNITLIQEQIIDNNYILQ